MVKLNFGRSVIQYKKHLVKYSLNGHIDFQINVSMSLHSKFRQLEYKPNITNMTTCALSQQAKAKLVE